MCRLQKFALYMVSPLVLHSFSITFAPPLQKSHTLQSEVKPERMFFILLIWPPFQEALQYGPTMGSWSVL